MFWVVAKSESCKMKEPLLNLEPKTFAATLLSICSSRRSRSKRRRRRVLHTFCPSHSPGLYAERMEASPWSSLFTIRVYAHTRKLPLLSRRLLFCGHLNVILDRCGWCSSPTNTKYHLGCQNWKCGQRPAMQPNNLRGRNYKRRAEILKRRLPNNGAAAWPTLWVQVSQGEIHHHSQLGR